MAMLQDMKNEGDMRNLAGEDKEIIEGLGDEWSNAAKEIMQTSGLSKEEFTSGMLSNAAAGQDGGQKITYSKAYDDVHRTVTQGETGGIQKKASAAAPRSDTGPITPDEILAKYAGDGDDGGREMFVNQNDLREDDIFVGGNNDVGSGSRLSFSSGAIEQQGGFAPGGGVSNARPVSTVPQTNSPVVSQPMSKPAVSRFAMIKGKINQGG
jgi:hypothetical protein